MTIVAEDDVSDFYASYTTGAGSNQTTNDNSDDVT